MTHFPNIHTKAEQLMRDSRGRLTLRDAYIELNRRAQVVRRCKVTVNPDDPAIAAVESPRYRWQGRADLQ